MESICPIDSKCAGEVSALLALPSPQEVQNYFDELISTRQCRGIKVKQNGSFGKGVFADMYFKEEELVLKDQTLVGSQHTSNKIECFVCSFCFQFIGSIELQIGRRLYLQNLGVPASHECEMENQSLSDYCESDSSDGDNIKFSKDEENKGGCSSGISDNKIPLPKGVVESLMNGDLLLPFSSEFPLPPAIPCIGGCGEAFYCCKSCADSDWELSHSLLCTGQNTAPLSKEALLKFTEHANETNDIFLLAAKAISSTILKYRKLKASGLLGQEKQITPLVSKTVDLPLLLEAWKPISMGHKKKWWDCIALPVDVDSSNELDFRIQIREMAFKSLQLLKSAIFDEECEPLFSLEIYGHIIGMFELNNLDLVVASPVEDYFLYIDDLPSSEKKKVEITQQILDALGEDYSISCQGTAFYSLQSCMNHSCSPNAHAFKREEDRDGQATIIALRPICRGEEITISYVDEELPFEDRQALLADYGFECKCRKCLREQP